MKRAAGLWVDHRKAVLVIVTDEGEEIKRIESNMQKHIRFAGRSNSQTPDGLKQVTAEDQRDRQFENRLGNYYDDIIASIGAAGSIQLFGPGEAKGELGKRLEGKEPGARIVAIETADKMTDRQIAAKVRQHILQRGPIRGRYAAVCGMPANAGTATVKNQRRITHQPE
jgi:hypothetical protein